MRKVFSILLLSTVVGLSTAGTGTGDHDHDYPDPVQNPVSEIN